MNILRSFTETVVTTPTDTFPISFEYDEKYDAVHVFLNDVAVEDLGYTVSQVNAVTLKVEPAIPEGTVRIERETDIDKMKYIFDAGALFIDQNVDADFRQIVHSQQEVRDGFIKLRGDVLPLVHGLQEALQQAQEASEAAQEAANAAEVAASQTQYYLKYFNPEIEYPKNARIMLANGDVVQSTIANNVNNPNLDMSGWLMKLKGVVSSKVELEGLSGSDGQVVLMTGYYAGQYMGGDHFKYDSTQALINNGVTVINGWVKQFSAGVLTVSACGADPSASDHSAALDLAVNTATSLKRKLVVDFDLRVNTTTELDATLRIEGDGGAVQFSRSITATADIPIFTVKAGFSSESSYFGKLMFKASTGGTATAFRSTSNGYLSQSTFDHCVFDRSLRYGIDANLILCDFQKCDFGTYMSTTNSVGFKAIRSLGIVGTREPNANTFYNCIFRRGTDDCMIEWDSYGTQWHFFACDLEQNLCTEALIKCTASSPIMFVGGYIEANTSTPYVIKTLGNSATGFVPLIKFQGIHMNRPCSVAIGKNTMANYPKYIFEGCYGQLVSAVVESSTGVLNDVALIENSVANHFTLATGGSVGDIRTLTLPSGFNAASRNFQAAKITNLTSYKHNYKKTINRDFTVGSSVGVASLSHPSISGASYGGRLLVNAIFGTTAAAGTNSAVYELLVTSVGTAKYISQIGSAGLTSGAAASHPSFTWSINSSNVLVATAVGSTAGRFAMEVFTTGNVQAT
ncbi:tailspike protein [Acinetobacter phage Acba_6]|uniref:Tailspike protein n=1 Tax=Acinetobacter phage Acba_6 TaxID=3024175 RepID=A0AAE9X3F6_9CAUD|nr:tailspike protein [Acinetobacter phage Acba_6]